MLLDHEIVFINLYGMKFYKLLEKNLLISYDKI